MSFGAKATTSKDIRSRLKEEQSVSKTSTPRSTGTPVASKSPAAGTRPLNSTLSEAKKSSSNKDLTTSSSGSTNIVSDGIKKNVPNAKSVAPGKEVGSAKSSKQLLHVPDAAEIQKKEEELAQKAEKEANDVMEALKGAEDLKELWSLRDALEKERCARRIPAEAVLRAERRATAAEDAAEAAIDECKQECECLRAQMERLKEDCRRDRSRAMEEVQAMQAIVDQKEVEAQRRVSEAEATQKEEVENAKMEADELVAQIREKAAEEARESTETEVRLAQQEAADAEAEIQDLRSELEDMASSQAKTKKDAIAAIKQRDALQMKMVEVEAWYRSVQREKEEVDEELAGLKKTLAEERQERRQKEKEQQREEARRDREDPEGLRARAREAEALERTLEVRTQEVAALQALVAQLEAQVPGGSKSRGGGEGTVLSSGSGRPGGVAGDGSSEGARPASGRKVRPRRTASGTKEDPQPAAREVLLSSAGEEESVEALRAALVVREEAAREQVEAARQAAEGEILQLTQRLRKAEALAADAGYRENAARKRAQAAEEQLRALQAQYQNFQLNPSENTLQAPSLPPPSSNISSALRCLSQLSTTTTTTATTIPAVPTSSDSSQGNSSGNRALPDVDTSQSHPNISKLETADSLYRHSPRTEPGGSTESVPVPVASEEEGAETAGLKNHVKQIEEACKKTLEAHIQKNDENDRLAAAAAAAASAPASSSGGEIPESSHPRSHPEAPGSRFSVTTSTISVSDGAAPGVQDSIQRKDSAGGWINQSGWAGSDDPSDGEETRGDDHGSSACSSPRAVHPAARGLSSRDPTPSSPPPPSNVSSVSSVGAAGLVMSRQGAPPPNSLRALLAATGGLQQSPVKQCPAPAPQPTGLSTVMAGVHSDPAQGGMTAEARTNYSGENASKDGAQKRRPSSSKMRRESGNSVKKSGTRPSSAGKPQRKMDEDDNFSTTSSVQGSLLDEDISRAKPSIKAAVSLYGDKSSSTRNAYAKKYSSYLSK